MFISGFDVVYPEPKNTLLAWVGGRGAIEMEKLSDRQISDECMKLIKKFLNNSSLPDPSKFYCSRWKSNELVGGAYSFTSKGTDHIGEWEKVLSQPIVFDNGNSNVVLLAGEACHQQYFSTVHGAFLSGIEQAERILSLNVTNVSCFSKL